jgi:hypothetical protein
VQHAFQHTESDTNALALPRAVHAGDLIVVAIVSAFRTVTALVDSTSGHAAPPNTYQRVGQPLVADHYQNTQVDLWYAHSVLGGALTVTVSFSPSSSPYTSGETNVGLYEFAGLNKTVPVEQVTAAVGSGNKPDGGKLTTRAASEALYFVVGIDLGPDGGNMTTPATPGTGYTLLDHQDEGYARCYTEDQIAPQGTFDTNFTIAYASDWGVMGVALRP